MFRSLLLAACMAVATGTARTADLDPSGATTSPVINNKAVDLADQITPGMTRLEVRQLMAGRKCFSHKGSDFFAGGVEVVYVRDRINLPNGAVMAAPGEPRVWAVHRK